MWEAGLVFCGVNYFLGFVGLGGFCVLFTFWGGAGWGLVWLGFIFSESIVTVECVVWN